MVGRIVKKAGRVAWRLLAPVRRPLRARFDARVSQLVSNTLDARIMPVLGEAFDRSDARLGRIEHALGSANQAASAVAEEMDLVLGSLSREVFRLQAQVEELRSYLAADAEAVAPARFAVIDQAGESGGDADDDGPIRVPLPADRAMVG